VIDDGRRFLERSSVRFDVIVIDPPPPPSAPASSLLYSRQFYDVIRRRLAPDGILQIWYPAELHDRASLEAVATSIYASFPYVRAYRSVEDWGVHFLATLVPLPGVTAERLAARLPARAAADLIEWTPDETPAELFGEVLDGALSSQMLLGAAPVHAIDDDRPINEYYWLRSVRLGRH
jgi:spermidine synthase